MINIIKKCITNKCQFSKELRLKTKEFFKLNYENKTKDHNMGLLYNLLLLKNINNINNETYKSNKNELLDKIIKELAEDKFNFYLYNFNNLSLLLKNLIGFNKENYNHEITIGILKKVIYKRTYLYNNDQLAKINNYLKVISKVCLISDYDEIKHNIEINDNKIKGRNLLKDLNLDILNNYEISYDTELNTINIHNNKNNFNILFYKEDNLTDANKIIHFINKKKKIGNIFFYNNLNENFKFLESNKNNLKNSEFDSLLDDIKLINNKIKENKSDIDLKHYHYQLIKDLGDHKSLINYLEKNYIIDKNRNNILNKDDKSINFTNTILFLINDYFYSLKRENKSIFWLNKYEYNNIKEYILKNDLTYFQNLLDINNEIDNNILTDYSSIIYKLNCTNKTNINLFSKQDILENSNLDTFYSNNFSNISKEMINNNLLNDGCLIINYSNLKSFLTSLTWELSKDSTCNNSEVLSTSFNDISEPGSNLNLDKKLLIASKIFNISLPDLRSIFNQDTINKSNPDLLESSILSSIKSKIKKKSIKLKKNCCLIKII